MATVVVRDVPPAEIEGHPWTAQFIRGRGERIENDVPCLDLSFTETK
jgi:Mn-containing catalase